ncbi:MAG: alkaline phosphatase D family protein [Myxococcales bacterium]|nr:alkaline phosphatase D family protein [Myxococcales bacterium]
MANPSRRDLLRGSAAAVALAACRRSPQVQVPRIVLPRGVSAGDVDGAAAVVWAQSDRLAELLVEWDTSERFANPRRVRGPRVDPAGDLAGVVELTGLPPGQTIVYRVVFEDGRDRSAPTVGRFVTPPAAGATWRFAWSGDTCGQGYGRNPEFGGLRIFEAIRAAAPRFFLNSGDLIYGDNPIPPEIALPGGRLWRNTTDEILARVAESLADFRHRFAYNLDDLHLRALLAECAVVAQWDDHETHNNWYPGQVLDDDRYTERDASVLAARARQALFDYTPIRRGRAGAGAPIQRVLRYGPDVDLVVVDLRSFRTPNDANDRADDGAAMLGSAQARWLVDALATSRATWKIVASDQPLGVVIPDGDGPNPDQEGWGQGAGPPRGRERELAWVLGELHRRGVADVVWLTADVHYAAAHHFDPARGTAGAFTPFWEFIAGPLHAGTFGPNPLDPTFGPEARFVWAPPAGTGNLAPWDGLQSFGTVEVDGGSRALTVRLHGPGGEEKFAVTLPPTRR